MDSFLSDFKVFLGISFAILKQRTLSLQTIQLRILGSLGLKGFLKFLFIKNGMGLTSWRYVGVEGVHCFSGFQAIGWAFVFEEIHEAMFGLVDYLFGSIIVKLSKLVSLLRDASSNIWLNLWMKTNIIRWKLISRHVAFRNSQVDCFPFWFFCSRLHG